MCDSPSFLSPQVLHAEMRESGARSHTGLDRKVSKVVRRGFLGVGADSSSVPPSSGSQEDLRQQDGAFHGVGSFVL